MQTLAAGDLLRHTIQLFSKKEVEKKHTICVVATDNYDNLVKETNFRINANYAWPKIRLDCLDFDVKHLAGKTERFERIYRDAGKPQIFSVEIDGIRSEKKVIFNESDPYLSLIHI